MAIDLDGNRSRYFHERVKVDAQQGDPMRAGVSDETRRRLVREVRSLAWQMGQGTQPSHPFIRVILAEMDRVFGMYGSDASLESNVCQMALGDS